MLKRKIADLIEQHLKSGSDRILLIDGARQVGKTYIIRHVGSCFPISLRSTCWRTPSARGCLKMRRR